MTPTGISVGAIIILEKVSAIKRKIPPMQNETGPRTPMI